jgi:hypothetical protein
MLPGGAGIFPYNRAMTNLEIIVPFALPPAEHAKDLLAALKVPSLARLLARARPGQKQAHENFAAALPHEQWLSPAGTDRSPPLARAAMAQLGITAGPGTWFLLQPASLHIARDHLVLTDYRQLNLSESASRALFDAALPLFVESGLDLRYGNAGLWFLRADEWQDLRCSTPDAACGHNIDIWLPKGAGERAWRKLQNELQMLWHTHAVNEEREGLGMRRINTVWLWGGSPAQTDADVPGLQKLAGQLTGQQARVGNQAVIMQDELSGAALAGDWSQWLSAFMQLEEQQFSRLLTGLNEGRIEALTFVLTDSHRLQQWHVTRASMRKFWLSPSLARLHP